MGASVDGTVAENGIVSGSGNVSGAGIRTGIGTGIGTSSRQTLAAESFEGVFDLLVIGGGINGVGIARDAAGRGLRVALCEQDDLAAHTSSASTKLIHGGLRYLEYGEFGLVRRALQERETLLRAAPHIIRPLRFVMPHVAALRPAWQIRLGLFLYDHLAHRHWLPGSAAIDLRRHPAGAPLVDSLRRGFVYSDAWVDDARLVILNAMDAAERGAIIATHTRLTHARRIDVSHPAPGQHDAPDAATKQWEATLVAQPFGTITVRARALVNAAGPWVGALLEHGIERGSDGDTEVSADVRAEVSAEVSAEVRTELATGVANRVAAGGASPHHAVRLVKGSHIVLPKLFEHDHAYLFQHHDKRVIFAIPYERDFTLVGTTDVSFEAGPDAAARVQIDASEAAYLCDVINHYFKRHVTPAEIRWSYSGVRPLLEDEHADNPSAVTRDYHLELDRGAGNAPRAHAGAPLLSVFGGKITTFRKLASQAIDLLAPLLGNHQPRWTHATPLPGGDLGSGGVEQCVRELRSAYPWLPEALAQRYAHAYGTRARRWLAEADSLDALGEALAPGLYAAELRYLQQHEWARSADDVLWRRSKLGLHLPPERRAAVARRIDDWLAHNQAKANHNVVNQTPANQSAID